LFHPNRLAGYTRHLKWKEKNNNLTQEEITMKRSNLALVLSIIMLLGLFLAGCRPQMDQPTWIPINETEGQSAMQNNFGPGAWGIASLEVYKDQLYAGTGTEAHGPRISRTSDGINWEFASEEAFGYPLPEKLEDNSFSIGDLQEFHDQLYAGLTWYETSTSILSSKGAQVWRSSDGSNWTNVVEGGFGNSTYLGVSSMAVFNDNLYIATDAWDDVFQIWRSPTGDKGSWIQVATDSLGCPSNQAAFLIPFENKLILMATMWSLGYTTFPVCIWYTEDGVKWTSVTTNGFDKYQAVAPSQLAIFKDYLYVGVNAIGSNIWRSKNGITWAPVTTNGFEGTIKDFSALFVYDGYLFANVSQVSAIHMYYSVNGETWTQVKGANYGNDNPYLIDLNPAIEFKGDLYFGGYDDAGAQVWKVCTDCK
jgi:hypothetical protein